MKGPGERAEYPNEGILTELNLKRVDIDVLECEDDGNEDTCPHWRSREVIRCLVEVGEEDRSLKYCLAGMGCGAADYEGLLGAFEDAEAQPDDWRRFIPPRLRELWERVSNEMRCGAYLVAKDAHDRMPTSGAGHQGDRAEQR